MITMSNCSIPSKTSFTLSLRDVIHLESESGLIFQFEQTTKRYQLEFYNSLLIPSINHTQFHSGNEEHLMSSLTIKSFFKGEIFYDKPRHKNTLFPLGAFIKSERKKHFISFRIANISGPTYIKSFLFLLYKLTCIFVCELFVPRHMLKHILEDTWDRKETFQLK